MTEYTCDSFRFFNLFPVYFGGKGTDIVLKDTGPGIADVEQAMQAGWSTAPDNVRALGFGAGMGLPNMKKYSDEMKIDSVVGEGTTVTMTVFPGRKEEGR